MNRIHNAGTANPVQAWTSLAFSSAQMMATSAQVVGMRVQRMLLAGARPELSDHVEMGLMGSEKVEAITESGQAIAQGVMLLNQQLFALAARQAMAGVPIMVSLATSLTPAMFAAGQARVVRAAVANSKAATATVSAAAPRIAAKAIKPIHSRATANGRRLAKSKH